MSSLALTVLGALQIPGLNAPIPPGTQFGYQAGGWGKPPVDEAGEPLYGDVFGVYGEEDDGEQVRLNKPLERCSFTGTASEF